MSQDEEFVSVTNGEIWDPRVDEKKQPKTPTEDSCIVGTFLGFEENQGKDSNSNLYRILAEKVNGVTLPEPRIMSFWGSHVLDERILVKAKLQEGMRFKVLWKGLKQPKNAGGRPYHDWEVFVPKGTATSNAPVSPAAPMNPPATPATPAAAPAVTPAAASTPAIAPNPAVAPASTEAEDDLPF